MRSLVRLLFLCQLCASFRPAPAHASATKSPASASAHSWAAAPVLAGAPLHPSSPSSTPLSGFSAAPPATAPSLPRKHTERGLSTIPSESGADLSPGVRQSQSAGEGEKSMPSRTEEYGGAWSPPPNRFLLAVCLFGRLSNQVKCMRSAFDAARIVNRTLLIPHMGFAGRGYLLDSKGYEFPWDVPVDWVRMRNCLAPLYGNRTVMTAAEYVAQYGKPINVTLFQGIVRGKQLAYREQNMDRFLQLNKESLHLPHPSTIPKAALLKGFEDAEHPVPPAADVARAAASIDDEVISFGELFGFDATPRPPRHKAVDKGCTNLWRPDPRIMKFVQGASKNLLGGGYGAVHLRRGDFYMFRSKSGRFRGKDLAKKEGFLPIAVFAAEVRKQLEQRNISRLFLATNARKLERELFRTIVEAESSVDTVLTLNDIVGNRAWLEKQAWARGALDLDRKLQRNGVVVSLIDKYVCVNAIFFYGTEASSFTSEIKNQLRPDELYTPHT